MLIDGVFTLYKVREWIEYTYKVEVGPFFFFGADTGFSGGVSGVFSTGLVTILTSKYTPYMLMMRPAKSKKI